MLADASPGAAVATEGFSPCRAARNSTVRFSVVGVTGLDSGMAWSERSTASVTSSSVKPTSDSARGASRSFRSAASASLAARASPPATVPSYPSAAARRPASSGTAGALNARTYGSTVAWVSAWGRLNVPPSTCAILWWIPEPADANDSAER